MTCFWILVRRRYLWGSRPIRKPNWSCVAEGEIPLGSNPYKEGVGTSWTKTGGAVPQVSRVALPLRLCASQKQGETDLGTLVAALNLTKQALTLYGFAGEVRFSINEGG